mmetsp:Transcript_7097/g.8187  ORF Transcript_7097/g.8187 Transcript_7097/m.8187 type:complete len:363 (+) Transcript_7097:329-1417(+)|eukprot:CAMPEP_0197844772 /NCGR_PEP_ID=MMETSP1438-20131217/1751_1 /TAXON_ID=1461541 /ORGANISM="Pterosperma sp., Strain CCMP1384" /LENGTH=362 /DNA_ID=CAMNT_0043455741 /DNA_START=329 /DNA_END=1417 /DNA_ORIENTATION=+
MTDESSSRAGSPPDEPPPGASRGAERKSLDSKLSEDGDSFPNQRLPNLDSLFIHTTPCVPVLRDPKLLTNYPSHNGQHESQHFFHLQDLWESYEEWSAYGAEVPLVLESGEEVLQYYVPYLSGMQLYAADPSTLRQRPSDTSSDEYDLSEPESEDQNNRGTNGHMSDCDSMTSSSEDGGKPQHHRARLLFQYFERAAPYTRSPLADKVLELSRESFPGLFQLRSCDLDPASWIAVAWYPIYRIPTGRSLRDLSACFLTYHCMCLPQDKPEEKPQFGCPLPPKATVSASAALDQRCARLSRAPGVPTTTLRPFGFSAYKLKGEVWNSPGSGVSKIHTAMRAAARNWLNQLQVRHPDFDFFLYR